MKETREKGSAIQETRRVSQLCDTLCHEIIPKAINENRFQTHMEEEKFYRSRLKTS